MIHDERQNLRMAKSVKTLFGVVMIQQNKSWVWTSVFGLRDISLALWVNYILRIYSSVL